MPLSLVGKLLNRLSKSLPEESSEEAKHHSIKAFRTITTMLDIVPSQRVMTVVDRMPGGGLEDKELKLLNALATLLVRRNEVAAVAVTQHDNGSGLIQVIACHHVSSDSPLGVLTIPQLALSSNILSNFLATFNPRKDTLNYMSDRPAIIDPKIPPEIQDTDDMELIRTYFYDNWKKETYDTHAWMLGRLTGNFNILQEYVVAACYGKILTRMKDKNFSLPYLDTIMNLTNFRFKETHLEPKTKEGRMEQTFAKALLALTNARLLDTSVPNLLAVISKESDELYTKETCQEFHLLLCELLKLFIKHLEQLNSIAKATKPVRSIFDGAVRKVVCYGEALQLMAGGLAIQRHFQVIEDELSNSYHKLARDVANQTVQTFEALSNVDSKREHDVKLQSVQPFAIRDGKPLTMSNSAKDWLNLMVVHFNAIKIVAAYYDATRMIKMTIKIILPPKLEDKMLSWKDLLQDEKFIKPTDELYNPFNIPTSKDIIKFLEVNANDDKMAPSKGSSSIQDMLEVVTGLAQSSSSQAVVLDRLKTMETQLSGLRAGMSPDQDELTLRIRSKIEQLKNIHDESSKPSWWESLYSIGEMLESLAVSALFFKKLRGSPLSNGKGFSGATHCEIFLASLIVMAKTSPLTLPEDVQQELSNAGHILGISKPSCPVCMEALCKLSSFSEPFIFRGSHSTILACTLPTFLPKDVIDDVARTFGTRLRADLIKLVGRKNIPMQGRPKTSQSATLSMDSSDGSTEELYGRRNLDNREDYYAHISPAT